MLIDDEADDSVDGDDDNETSIGDEADDSVDDDDNEISIGDEADRSVDDDDNDDNEMSMGVEADTRDKTNQGAHSLHINHGLPSDVTSSFKTSQNPFPTQNESLITSLLDGMIEFCWWTDHPR